MDQVSRKVDVEAFQADTGVDDNETLKELYSAFLEEMLQEKEKLLAMLSKGDFVSLGRVVHNVKGVSGSYNANRIYDIAAEFNRRLKANNLEDAEQWTKELADAILEADGEIREYFGL